MKCQALIDWLTFSVKTEKDPAAVIIEYLGMDPDLFQEAGSCLPGYQSAMRFSDIIVCYDPRENEHFKDIMLYYAGRPPSTAQRAYWAACSEAAPLPCSKLHDI